MTHPLTTHLRDQLAAHADPAQAPAMQAYMKTEQPFYGVKSPLRKQIFRAAKKQFKLETRADYEQVVLEMWHGRYREESYLALAVAELYRPFNNDESWPLFVKLAKSAPHWDTLDWIAANLIGPLVRTNRAHEATLVEWSNDDSFWVRRASLLAHLNHKADTNIELLSTTILKLAHEKEFFIRKAIGWVLREYSRTDPDWVQAFVNEHNGRLSGLSKREALKRIQRAAR